MAMHLRNDKRTIFGWAMYDWANSAYITAGALVFSIYFADTVFPEDGLRLAGVTFEGETFWALLVGIGAILVAIAMPALGAAADFSNSKRRLLMIFGLGGAAFAVLLAIPGSGDWPLALLLALGAQFGFVAGNVMYDGFLPDITTDDTVDRVSARGFAFGYIGGGLHLALSLALLNLHESVGLSEPTAQRIVVISSGLWWGLFGLVAYARLQEIGSAQALPAKYQDSPRVVAYLLLGVRRTLDTLVLLPRFRQLLLFLVAFLIYNDGIQTIIAVSPVYASETLELETATIAAVFLVIQIVAFFGALLFGWLAPRLGTKQAILVSLVVWALLTVFGYFLPVGQAVPFLVLGVFAGLVLGGSQALSRSLYASMIPQEASAEFFGFFTVFRRFSAFWGPLLFAGIGAATGSTRNSILVFVLSFVIGAILLAFVDVEKGRADRARWRFEGAKAEAA